MDYMMLFDVVGLLGLRVRYWIIIIVIVVILLAVLFMARGRRR